MIYKISNILKPPIRIPLLAYKIIFINSISANVI